jgi:hypothetical protein
VFKKLLEKRYIDKQKKICSLGELTKKENVEIIIRANEVITGFAIYYLPIITADRYFNHLHYILEYSFYKTLCHKNKTTINKLMTGHENKIKYQQINLNNPEFSKTHEIISTKNIKEKLDNTIKDIKNNLFNRTDQKLLIKNILLEYKKGYWRTNASMNSACIYCGSWENIEYHHIKKLGSDKRKYIYDFDYNIRAINRKAIPLCAECHLKVHKGTLNTQTINELYDKRLAQYQSYIKIRENNTDNIKKNE